MNLSFRSIALFLISVYLLNTAFADISSGCECGHQQKQQITMDMPCHNSDMDNILESNSNDDSVCKCADCGLSAQFSLLLNSSSYLGQNTSNKALFTNINFNLSKTSSEIYIPPIFYI